MKSSECKIYYDSEFVSWTIPKHCIEDTLLGMNKKQGLLYVLEANTAPGLEGSTVTKYAEAFVKELNSDANRAGA